jgi:negative regulator of sigma E activity
MRLLVRYLAFILVVQSAYAQSGKSVQKPESWNLTVVEILMYPGSSVQYNQTVIATYDWQSQCESARRTIQTKFNASVQCILKIKTKANI